MSERPKGRDWKSCVPLIAGPWVRIPLSPPEDGCRNIDSWVLRNGNLQTPSGPEGSSGSKTFHVPQGSLAINILTFARYAHDWSNDLPALPELGQGAGARVGQGVVE